MFDRSQTLKRGAHLCAALLLCALCGAAGASTSVSAQTALDAHRHPKLGDVRELVLPDVRIVGATLEKGATKENLARSRDGRYEAFTVFRDGQSPADRIYFRERRTGKTYEIRGLPLSHRPFSALAWANNRTLVFDRWSQPHYGIHYAVNVRRKRLVKASAFPDELTPEEQKPNASVKKEQ